MKLLALNPKDEAELLRTCVHEAAHEAVARHYGLNPQVFIGGPGNGVTRLKEGSPLAVAAVGWAGTVAEVLYGHRANPCPVPLHGSCPADWWQEFLRGGHMDGVVNAEDKECIRADAASLRSFRAAYDLLVANADVIKARAELFAAQAFPLAQTSRFEPDLGNSRVERWASLAQDMARTAVESFEQDPVLAAAKPPAKPPGRWGLDANGQFTTDVVVAIEP